MKIRTCIRISCLIKDITAVLVLAALTLTIVAPLTVVRAQRPDYDRDFEATLANPTDTFEPEYKDGELLVSFQPGTSHSRMNDSRNAVGAVTIKKFAEINVEHWRLPAGRGVENAISALANNPNIRFAEPNYIVHASDFPESQNDAMRSDLWGLHNLGQSGGTLNADINAPEAWAVTTGSSDVVIGVIDSGIDYTHQDLAANIWVNSNEIPSNNTDDDGNGYVDDTRGWDFANNDNDPIDDNGHGTHVAGTIGAAGNNAIGVVGVNWNVKLMPLKFLGANGSGDIANAISAVTYASSFTTGGNKVVRITNNSWGGGRKSAAMQSAISNSGALFVAAAGNGATSQIQYPAGYNNSNLISVAATDHNDNLASFSNFSTSWVDLAAPGVNIISTYRGSYTSLNGTSMASPHVAGVAGLVMAATPGISLADAKSAIMNSVDVLPSLAGKTLTGGRLNAGRAVGSSAVLSDDCPLAPCSPADVSDLNVSPATSPTSLSLTWTATGDDGSSGSAYLADIRYSTSPINPSNFAQATVANGEPNPGAAGSAQNFTITGLRGGTTYYFAARWADEIGNYSGLATASGTTAAAPWNITVVDDPANNVGFYKSIKYDNTGMPAIGYSDDSADDVRFARWNGASWNTELVDTFSGPGVSMAFDTYNNPAITYGWGRLMYAQYVPSSHSWQLTTLETRNAYNDYTSLAYAPDGSAGVSYRTATNSGRGSLKFAKRGPTGWTLQTVASAGARYNSLAYDDSGYPAIAFSDDVNGDGSLDTLKLARWNGSAWNIQTVETGVVGYGVYASLVFDQNGNPAISHVTGGTVRFVTWNGGSWDATEVAGYGYNSRLVFNNADYSFYVSYVESDNTIRIARRVGPGNWTSEAIDFGNLVRGPIDLAISSCGTPSAVYSTYPNQDLKFATGCTPGP